MSELDERDPIGSVFAELIGLPCWGVQKGHGSMLTFEFGAPHLSIREPIRNPITDSPKVRRILRRRHVVTRGEWYLWIGICHWLCMSEGHVLGTDLSPDDLIVEVARELNGQRLVSVEIEPQSRGTRFTFDLGGSLEIKPYEDEDKDEQWSLFTPEGMVFSYRADGCYLWIQSDLPPGREHWRPLPR